MARYVLLSFEDNAEAEKFVEEGIGIGRVLESMTGDLKMRFKILAMFAQPTQFCGGAAAGCTQTGRVRAYSRGKKYGWWVCVGCMKPAKHGPEKTARAVVSQGVNLLEGSSDDDVMTPFDQGWGAYGRKVEIPPPGEVPPVVSVNEGEAQTS